MRLQQQQQQHKLDALLARARAITSEDEAAAARVHAETRAVVAAVCDSDDDFEAINNSDTEGESNNASARENEATERTRNNNNRINNTHHHQQHTHEEPPHIEEMADYHRFRVGEGSAAAAQLRTALLSSPTSLPSHQNQSAPSAATLLPDAVATRPTITLAAATTTATAAAAAGGNAPPTTARPLTATLSASASASSAAALAGSILGAIAASADRTAQLLEETSRLRSMLCEDLSSGGGGGGGGGVRRRSLPSASATSLRRGSAGSGGRGGVGVGIDDARFDGEYEEDDEEEGIYEGDEDDEDEGEGGEDKCPPCDEDTIARLYRRLAPTMAEVMAQRKALKRVGSAMGNKVCGGATVGGSVGARLQQSLAFGAAGRSAAPAALGIGIGIGASSAVVDAVPASASAAPSQKESSSVLDCACAICCEPLVSRSARALTTAAVAKKEIHHQQQQQQLRRPFSSQRQRPLSASNRVPLLQQQQHHAADEESPSPFISPRGNTNGEGAASASSSSYLPPPPLLVVALVCGHTFCDSCLVTWLRISGSCPTCRRAVTKEDYPPPPMALRALFSHPSASLPHCFPSAAPNPPRPLSAVPAAVTVTSSAVGRAAAVGVSATEGDDHGGGNTSSLLRRVASYSYSFASAGGQPSSSSYSVSHAPISSAVPLSAITATTPVSGGGQPPRPMTARSVDVGARGALSASNVPPQSVAGDEDSSSAVAALRLGPTGSGAVTGPSPSSLAPSSAFAVSMMRPLSSRLRPKSATAASSSVPSQRQQAPSASRGICGATDTSPIPITPPVMRSVACIDLLAAPSTPLEQKAAEGEVDAIAAEIVADNDSDALLGIRTVDDDDDADGSDPFFVGDADAIRGRGGLGTNNVDAKSRGRDGVALTPSNAAVAAAAVVMPRGRPATTGSVGGGGGSGRLHAAIGAARQHHCPPTQHSIAITNITCDMPIKGAAMAGGGGARHHQTAVASSASASASSMHPRPSSSSNGGTPKRGNDGACVGLVIRSAPFHIAAAVASNGLFTRHCGHTCNGETTADGWSANVVDNGGNGLRSPIPAVGRIGSPSNGAAAMSRAPLLRAPPRPQSAAVPSRSYRFSSSSSPSPAPTYSATTSSFSLSPSAKRIAPSSTSTCAASACAGADEGALHNGILRTSANRNVIKGGIEAAKSIRRPLFAPSASSVTASRGLFVGGGSDHQWSGGGVAHSVPSAGAKRGNSAARKRTTSANGALARSAAGEAPQKQQQQQQQTPTGWASALVVSGKQPTAVAAGGGGGKSAPVFRQQKRQP